MQIPKVYPLAAICGTYIPQTPNGIKNRIEQDADGGFVARLSHGHRLRVLRIGGRWAVAENDLVDFLRAAGMRFDSDEADAQRPPAPRQPAQLRRQPSRAELEAAAPPASPRRRGRPRKSPVIINL
jgi:hypothetical protein